MAKLAALCLFLAFLVGCDDPGRTDVVASPAGSNDLGRLYEGNATVLENESLGPMLCVGFVLGSLPPGCGDVPITNWDWSQVEGEERYGGVTWGDYHLVGGFDGKTFTVTDVGPPEATPARLFDPIDTPCPTPKGGWKTVDPDHASEFDADETIDRLHVEPGYGGGWIDYAEEVDPSVTTGQVILTVGFTKHPARHKALVRETWGGPLCLIKHPHHTRRELDRIMGDVRGRFGLQVLWVDAVPARGIVEMGVVASTPWAEARLDERYNGVVKAIPSLLPVE